MLMNYYIGRLTTRKECTNIKNDVSLSRGLYQHNRRFILSCTAFYYCHGINSSDRTKGRDKAVYGTVCGYFSLKQVK